MTQTTLQQRYPYIFAVAADLGSLPYYPKQEAEVAAADGVPEDVTSRDEWDRIASHGRHERALAAEQAGTAVVLRNDNGEPYRVWWRIGGWTNEMNRDRVTRMAERIKAGQSLFTT